MAPTTRPTAPAAMSPYAATRIPLGPLEAVTTVGLVLVLGGGGGAFTSSLGAFLMSLCATGAVPSTFGACAVPSSNSVASRSPRTSAYQLTCAPSVEMEAFLPTTSATCSVHG